MTDMLKIIELGLINDNLYKGCEIEEVAGRLNLVTPVAKAVNIVGRNIEAMKINPEEVIMTGPMAIWSYLVVFHSILHRTKKVWYDDGRTEKVLIAAHG